MRKGDVAMVIGVFKARFWPFSVLTRNANGYNTPNNSVIKSPIDQVLKYKNNFMLRIFYDVD